MLDYITRRILILGNPKKISSVNKTLHNQVKIVDKLLCVNKICLKVLFYNKI